ncbi:guanylate cyclase domain-containing protein, partial [Haematococcus lacustris]
MATAAGPGQQEEIWQGWSTMPPGSVLLQQPGVQSVRVTVRSIVHPRTREGGLLVVQQDTTDTSAMEALLADLAESQLRMASNIFPRHVLEFLATNRGNNAPEDVAQLARQHKDVTLLFMDIVGFTSMAKEVAPETVMVFLNTLFGVFDLLVDVHGVMKVETAGDCYIVAGGILSFDRKKEANGSEPSELGQEFAEVLEHHDPADSAARVMAFAKDMMASSKQVKMPHNDEPVCIRIGLHTGDCVSGLIGTKAPKYAVFGDTMNTASRMESTCTPGRIQVSAVTHALLPHEAWEATGGVLAKGK